MQRWQYQARTEPIIVVDVPPQDNSADLWCPTIAYPPRRIFSLAALVAGMAAMGSVTPLVADRVDWFVQAVDQFPAPHLARPGIFSYHAEPIVPEPVLPDIPQTYDWDRSKIGPPDIRHYTMSLGPLGEPLIDWHLQEPDVIRPTPKAIEQPLYVQPLDPTLFPAVPGLDTWFNQQPDLVRGFRLHDYTQFTTDTEPILDPFDWWSQTIDMVAARPQAVVGYAEILLEPILPVLDVDWIVQHPGPIQPQRINEPGITARYVLPLFFLEDWHLQEPEPVLPRHQVDPGWFAYNSLIITPPDSPELAWGPDYADFAWAAPRPLDTGQLVEPLDPGLRELPPGLAWSQQEFDVARMAPPFDAGIWTSVTEPIAAIPPTVEGFEITVTQTATFHVRMPSGRFEVVAVGPFDVRISEARFDVTLPEGQFHSRVAKD